MPGQPTVSETARGRVQICQQTGLALVPYPEKGTWRVYKTVHGPESSRPRTSKNPLDWSRFDLPGQSTLYTSTTKRGSYMEVLAPLRPRISELSLLAAQVFDDVAPGSDPILDDWSSVGHMYPRGIPRIWWSERSVAQIHVPDKGWFVDLEDPHTLQVLRGQFARALVASGLTDMDISVVRGPNRELTCAIAEWVSSLVLEDGSIPLGLRYQSRHTTSLECWAIFPDTTSLAVGTSALSRIDPTLISVAQDYGLRFH